MEKLRDSPDDFVALMGRTAHDLGLPLEFVEKDYWITELLRSVARPIDHGTVVLKGGTSLSKGYGLLQRFSEDVDILLVVTRRRDAGFGKGGVDAMLKGLCSRAQEDLGLAGDGAVLEGSSRGIHRNVRYAYPRRYEGSTVKPGVLLELGIRGCPEPMETRELRSFMAAHAVDALKDAAGAFDEYAAVPIAVLHPHRTLFEKLAVLHHLSVDLPGTETELRRAARHLYDIHQRLASDMVRNSLRASAGMAGSMAADMDRVSLEWGWPHSPRPAGGYARSPAFDPGHPSQVILEAGLEEVRDLILDRVPTLKECRLSVERAAPPL